MGAESSQIATNLCNYRHVPRDDGLSYGDHVEQLTCLQHRGVEC